VIQRENKGSDLKPVQIRIPIAAGQFGVNFCHSDEL
jgi:hypothetical protein